MFDVQPVQAICILISFFAGVLAINIPSVPSSFKVSLSTIWGLFIILISFGLAYLNFCCFF